MSVKGYDNFNYLKVYGQGALDGREPLYVSHLHSQLYEARLMTKLPIVSVLPRDERKSNIPERHWRHGG